MNTDEIHLRNDKEFPLNANPTIWSNTLKQFVSNSRRIVRVFDHFVRLVLKGLSIFVLRLLLFPNREVGRVFKLCI